ncbi:hypothetical protein E2C01_040067 [Portunus trituberculatus]|uniref:Uncharacterized protein n=1 Tax=Portunus trituberculatus TaxID=210409 RepID=A0A5B7FMZ3_PORTR|nr:hypothetical protein [Portunus trituberculatus]
MTLGKPDQCSKQTDYKIFTNDRGFYILGGIKFLLPINTTQKKAVKLVVKKEEEEKEKAEEEKNDKEEL